MELSLTRARTHMTFVSIYGTCNVREKGEGYQLEVTTLGTSGRLSPLLITKVNKAMGTDYQ